MSQMRTASFFAIQMANTADPGSNKHKVPLLQVAANEATGAVDNWPSH